MDMERVEKIKQKYSNANIIEHINGKDIIAVDKAELELFISTIEEQQEEIEQLNKLVEKEMYTAHLLEGQAHDAKADMKKENARLREALEDIAYKGFNVEPKRVIVKLRNIAIQALENVK